MTSHVGGVRHMTGFLCDRKFLSHKMLRKDAHLAEMKYMLRIPLGRERVASDSFLFFIYSVSDSHMLCQVLAYHNGMGDILQFVFGTDA